VISDEITESDAAPVGKSFGTEVLFMSSGTTDKVKLCAYTGENFFWQICDSRNIIKQCPQIKEHYKGELKQLTLLPFYHVFGFIAVYLWFGFFSRTFVFPKDLNPVTVQNTIKKHEVTHIFAVPMVWERIYKAALKKVKEKGDSTYKKFKFALSLSNSLGSLGDTVAKAALKEVRENLFGDSVRFLISGGGGLAPDVFRFFNGIGYHLANGYGMTEIGITSVEKSNSKKILNSASVGAPFGYTEYKVTDSGELTVRGRTMASRILTGSEEKVTDFDAWFATKDLVSVNNGRYYINGRVDDLIICANGENLNPTLLEPSLKVAGCDAVCLFALPGGAPVLIASVLGCFSQTQMNDIFDRLDKALAETKLEKTVSKVVLTSDGLMEANDFKISRRKVREKYLAGSFNLIERGSIGEKIEEMLSDLEREVIECFASALERSPEEISPNANFFLDLGGTSLDYFTLLGLLKDKYGISLPSDDKEKLFTVRDFCEFIKN
jgi:long-chain acyl-CoA synthetase